VLQGIAPDGKLYVTARAGRDTAALYLYDPATDKLADKPLLASPQFDIAPQLIQRNGRVVGARFLIDAIVTHWFDDEMKAHQAVVDKLLPSHHQPADAPAPRRQPLDAAGGLLRRAAQALPALPRNHAQDHPPGRAAPG
jgi:hypothetical protein